MTKTSKKKGRVKKKQESEKGNGLEQEEGEGRDGGTGKSRIGIKVSGVINNMRSETEEVKHRKRKVK